MSEELFGTPPPEDNPGLVEVGGTGLDPLESEPSPAPDAVATPEGEPTTTPEGEQPPTEEPKKQTPNYQALYQAALNKVREYFPDKYAIFKADVNATAKTEPTPPLAKEQGSVYELTPDQLAGIIQEQTRAVLQAEKQAEREKSQIKMRKQEEQQAQNALQEYATAGGFTEQEVKDAITEVNKLGIDINVPGNYALAANLVAKELHMLSFQRGLKTATTKAEIEASAQQKAFLLAKQPEGVTAPNQPPLSEQRQFIENAKRISEGNLGKLIGT